MPRSLPAPPRRIHGVLALFAVALTSAGAFATTPAATTTPAPVICTLQQCTERALKRSPLMAAARSDLDKYRSLLSEANAARYPTFAATGFLAPLPEKREGTDGSDLIDDWDWTKLSPLASMQMTVTQVLWTFGKIDSLRDAARAGIDVGRAATRVATLEMRYQVARAWWGLLIAKELGQIIASGTERLTKERARLIADQEAAEEADKPYDPTALLRLRMAEADLEAKVRQSRRAERFAEDALRAAMNLAPDTPVQAKAEFIQPLAFTTLSMAAYEKLALANHPRLLALRNGTTARFAQLQYQKSQLWPDVVLTARIAYTYAPSVTKGNESLADNPTNPTQSGGGLGLRWRVDFRQFARIDRARAEHKKTVGLAQGEALKVRLSVRNLVREMVDGKAMIGVYEGAMKAARGWLSSEAQMSKGGFSDYKEVVRALEQYYRRKLAWLQSIYAYNVKVAELSRAVGMDVTRMRAEQPDVLRTAVTPKPAATPATPATKAAPPAAKSAQQPQKAPETK